LLLLKDDGRTIAAASSQARGRRLPEWLAAVA